jgi:hypothetical protein
MGSWAPPISFIFLFYIKEKWARTSVAIASERSSAVCTTPPTAPPKNKKLPRHSRNILREIIFKKNILRETGTQEISFQWATNETATGFASFLNNTLSI